MTSFWITTGLGFAVMMVGCALGNFVMFRMLEDVNARRGTREYISEIGWLFLKTRRVLTLHRSLVPESRLRTFFATACITLALGFVIASIGLFSSHAANTR
jgi:hypothetical protein